MNEGLREFDRQLDSCVAEVAGRGIRIDLAAVERLTRSDPASARSFIERQCRLAASQPAYLQLALAVASAYHTALGDPSLVVRVRERAASLFAEDIFEAGWAVFETAEAAAAEPAERERAREWWRNQPFDRSASCDECCEPISRGDGYLANSRTGKLFGSEVRLDPLLLCRRCFHQPRRG